MDQSKKEDVLSNDADVVIDSLNVALAVDKKRKAKEYCDKVWFYIGVNANILAIIGFYWISISFYNYYEGWDYDEAFYFITVSLATVGYGDITPTTDETRLYTVGLIIFSLMFILPVLSGYSGYVISLCLNLAIDCLFGKKEERDVYENVNILWFKQIFIAFLLALIVSVGMVFIHFSNPDYNVVISIYWTIQTLSTVGYGDIPLRTREQQLIVSGYILTALFIFSTALALIEEIKRNIDEIIDQQKTLGKQLTIREIMDLDMDGNGVDRFEYVMGILKLRGKVDYVKDVEPLLQEFHEIDLDHSGRLSRGELEIAGEKEREKLKRSKDDLDAKLEYAMALRDPVRVKLFKLLKRMTLYLYSLICLCVCCCRSSSTEPSYDTETVNNMLRADQNNNKKTDNRTATDDNNNDNNNETKENNDEDYTYADDDGFRYSSQYPDTHQSSTQHVAEMSYFHNRTSGHIVNS